MTAIEKRLQILERRVLALEKKLTAQSESMAAFVAQENKDKKEYKANFLWPNEAGTLEFHLYEFANAMTEEYRKEHYECIRALTEQKGVKQ